MASHGVTGHPAEVTFTPLLPTKLVLDLATPEGYKAELTGNFVGQHMTRKIEVTVRQQTG